MFCSKSQMSFKIQFDLIFGLKWEEGSLTTIKSKSSHIPRLHKRMLQSGKQVTSWWWNPAYETGLSSWCSSSKLLSNMTYMYLLGLTFVSEWLKRFGNSSSASTRICTCSPDWDNHAYVKMSNKLNTYLNHSRYFRLRNDQITKYW